MVFYRFADKVYRTTWPTALHPDNLEQIAYSKSLVSYGCQEACHDCPSLSGSVEVVLVRCALEPEHVEERYVDSAYGKWLIRWQYGEDPAKCYADFFCTAGVHQSGWDSTTIGNPISPQSGLNSVFLPSGSLMLWICMIVFHIATEAPVCYMNKFLNCQCVLFLKTSIIHANKHKTRVNSRICCLPLARKNGQVCHRRLIYSTLLLNLQMYFSCKRATI